jgi:sortase A
VEEPAEPEAPPPPVKPTPAPIPQEYYEDDPQFEDEFYAEKVKSDRAVRPGMVWNRLLLLVEVGAVAGLIFIFVGLFQTLQQTTQTSADIQAQYQATASARLIPPTSTPIINIADVVLPEGHTVNISNTGVVSALINLDEVPAQYRDQYQTFLLQPLTQPTPSPEGPVRLQIPKIKVDNVIVTGDSWAALQLGVGHHIGSANPGERGNIVLSAHDDVYGEIFKHLDQLQPGDSVTVSSMTKSYTYLVQNRQIVAPTDVWVMDAPRDGSRQLTLISCYPYQVDNKRIVVFATLQS